MSWISAGSLSEYVCSDIATEAIGTDPETGGESTVLRKMFAMSGSGVGYPPGIGRVRSHVTVIVSQLS